MKIKTTPIGPCTYCGTQTTGDYSIHQFGMGIGPGYQATSKGGDQKWPSLPVLGICPDCSAGIDHLYMKKPTKLELSKISLGHMPTRNAAFVPKKGKGASKKQDRRNWKRDISKEFA